MNQVCCSRCGRPLTDPYSIAVGMGPECRGGAKKKGWRFPKAKWRVSHGHVIFDGLDGTVEPPVVNVEEEEKDDGQEQ